MYIKGSNYIIHALVEPNINNGQHPITMASFVAQTVKNLPAMQETQVCSLGQEDPLEKEMATHSSVLAWRIPGTGAWWAVAYGVAQSRTRLT